ncbi:45564_t:CDS:1 [Gigaspora margarita]|uniref:45564_t:CDS:1 n=1 Tax=Gigaspora margarita TaxID=4874 RepID=A0ABM8VZ73_GIGMA|nr:45564_t:CDS:1 [Gigaspora margarita]
MRQYCSYILKNKLRHSNDLINVVHQSIVDGYNQAETVYDSSGNKKIIFYKWSKILSQFFTPIPSILKQYHFILSSKNVGKVEIRTTNDSTSKEINIARANSIPCMKDAFPEVIPAREISLKRQWYLYEEIRQHVQDPFKCDLSQLNLNQRN